MLASTYSRPPLFWSHFSSLAWTITRLDLTISFRLMLFTNSFLHIVLTFTTKLLTDIILRFQLHPLRRKFALVPAGLAKQEISEKPTKCDQLILLLIIIVSQQSLAYHMFWGRGYQISKMRNISICYWSVRKCRWRRHYSQQFVHYELEFF